MKILFVCRGNVGRSQIAEALFRKKFGEAHEVISAGTALSGPEQAIEEILPAINVIDIMKEENVDVSKSIRNNLTEEMVNWADKVVMMFDENDTIPDYIKNSQKVIYWNVTNPKGMDLGGHRTVKNQIKDLIETL